MSNLECVCCFSAHSVYLHRNILFIYSSDSITLEGHRNGRASRSKFCPKMQWNMVKLQGSPVWHCSLSWHWSRWTWRSALWLFALLPRSWFACRKVNPHFTNHSIESECLQQRWLSNTQISPHQRDTWGLGVTDSPLLLQVCFIAN